MVQTIKRGVAVLMTAATLLHPDTSVYAADNLLTAEYKSGRYTLNMQSEDFFDIKNLEFNKAYVKTLEFKNSGRKALTVSMVDVKNNLDESRLYDDSKLVITIGGEEVYSGPMNDASWSKTLYGGESFVAVYAYYINEPEHIPDNSWMNQDMHATFHFVGEWHNSSGGGHGVITPDYPVPKPAPSPTPDPTPPAPKPEEPSQIPKPDVVVVFPKTGDDFPLTTLCIAVAASATGIMVLTTTGKKKEDENEGK